jgi:hypothetical protein
MYISHEQGGPVITPGTGFPFRRLLRLAGLRWRYSNPTVPTEVKVNVTLRLKISQSVSLGVEPHLRIVTRYLLLFDSYGLDYVGRPL